MFVLHQRGKEHSYIYMHLVDVIFLFRSGSSPAWVTPSAISTHTKIQRYPTRMHFPPTPLMPAHTNKMHLMVGSIVHKCALILHKNPLRAHRKRFARLGYVSVCYTKRSNIAPAALPKPPVHLRQANYAAVAENEKRRHCRAVLRAQHPILLPQCTFSILYIYTVDDDGTLFMCRSHISAIPWCDTLFIQTLDGYIKRSVCMFCVLLN